MNNARIPREIKLKTVSCFKFNVLCHTEYTGLTEVPRCRRTFENCQRITLRTQIFIAINNFCCYVYLIRQVLCWKVAHSNNLINVDFTFVFHETLCSHADRVAGKPCSEFCDVPQDFRMGKSIGEGSGCPSPENFWFCLCKIAYFDTFWFW